MLVRRDTREKQFVKFEELATAIPAAMEALAKDLYDRALQNRENRTYSATTMDEVKQLAKEHTGFIKTMWCGDLACEEAMKEQAGLSSRCMPSKREPFIAKITAMQVYVFDGRRICCRLWRKGLPVIPIPYSGHQRRA